MCVMYVCDFLCECECILNKSVSTIAHIQSVGYSHENSAQSPRQRQRDHPPRAAAPSLCQHLRLKKIISLFSIFFVDFFCKTSSFSLSRFLVNQTCSLSYSHILFILPSLSISIAFVYLQGPRLALTLYNISLS